MISQYDQEQEELPVDRLCEVRVHRIGKQLRGQADVEDQRIRAGYKAIVQNVLFPEKNAQKQQNKNRQSYIQTE